MDRWDKSLRDHQYRYRNGERDNPSFSSTLLDSIYRSIDEGDGVGEEEEQLVFYRETMRKKHSTNNSRAPKEEDMASLNRRACMVEKWMEKKVSEKVVVRRKSSVAADYDRKSRDDRDPPFFKSTSSSSESSCGGAFSSSEAESVYNYGLSLSSQLPKPIRTSVCVQPQSYAQQQKPKHESSFVKTNKSRALKIYGDLKKVKQPISPGGRLANFLNSLFTAGNAKKAKISSSSSVRACGDVVDDSKSAQQASTCSSASSFSRSCLSKTPSSRGKLSNGAKRSVRFYPVSVIVDEDCRPCGHKSLYEDEPVLMTTVRNSIINEELKFHMMNKNRNHINEDSDVENDDDDDDAASCSSSDLFELDNLGAIGIDRYREELPVYETTHFDTNRAIANGLIV